MPLSLELKPQERLVIGRSVVRNGDHRTRLVIEGSDPILREKDIMRHEEATTPARRIYLAIQIAYVNGALDGDIHLGFLEDFRQAVPRASEIVERVRAHLDAGEYYRAMKLSKELIALETEILDASR